MAVWLQPLGMKLTPEQTETLRQWAEAGANLNDIQRQLKSELGVSCTYMDLRLGLMDLGIKLQDKPREQPAPEPVSATAAESAPESPFFDNAEDASDEAAAGGAVRVTLDELTIPGTMASGKATFSDGKMISWFVDQMGRLGMKAGEPGYQPPAEDVPEFQTQLDRLLMQAGF
jgi:hypothetical protein